MNPEARFFPGESTDDSNHKQEMVKDVLQWLKNELVDQGRKFLLISGDFGHGKTTLLQYLTAELSRTHQEGCPVPVYLPLRKYFIGNSLQNAVKTAISSYLRLTDDLWHEQQWLILCDGFDELNIYYQHQPDWVVREFTSLLKETYNSNIHLVISSRPILFLDPNLQKDTVALFDRLVLHPFEDDQIRQWLANWNRVYREIQFDMLKTRNLIDIVRTPVILFLIAQMFHDELAGKTTGFKRSEIYRRFFDWTVKSGGLPEKGKQRKHPVPDNYREVLQNIAWEIFTHYESKSGLLHFRVLLEQLRSRYPQADIQIDKRLFVAHAFREGIPEHIEFIHQSLREYLVAEKMFDVFFRIKDEPEGAYNIAYDTILSDRPVTFEKIRFFRDMIECIADNEISGCLQERSRNLYDWPTLLYQMAQKAPGRMTGYDIFRKTQDGIEKTLLYAENQITLANLVILGFLFELYLHNVTSVVESDFPVHLKQVSSFFESDLTLEPFLNLLRKSLTGLKWPDSVFTDICFDKFTLSRSKIGKSRFERCTFRETDFSDSIISGKTSEPVFTDCVFQRTSLKKTYIENILFKDCSFQKLSRHSEFHQKNVTYKNCQFKDCEFNDFTQCICTFTSCVFTDSFFFNMKPDDLKNAELQFDNCIVFRRDKYKLVEDINDIPHRMQMTQIIINSLSEDESPTEQSSGDG